MSPISNWSVFARQLALILVPLILSRVSLPPALADAISAPAVDLLSAGIVAGGVWLVGWVVWLGQRREEPAAKIEETAKLPEVRHIAVKDPNLAEDIPSPKVTP